MPKTMKCNVCQGEAIIGYLCVNKNRLPLLLDKNKVKFYQLINNFENIHTVIEKNGLVKCSLCTSCHYLQLYMKQSEVKKFTNYFLNPEDKTENIMCDSCGVKMHSIQFEPNISWCINKGIFWDKIKHLFKDQRFSFKIHYYDGFLCYNCGLLITKIEKNVDFDELRESLNNFEEIITSHLE